MVDEPDYVLYQMKQALARAEARLSTATIEARIAAEDVAEWQKRIRRATRRRRAVVNRSRKRA